MATGTNTTPTSPSVRLSAPPFRRCATHPRFPVGGSPVAMAAFHCRPGDGSGCQHRSVAWSLLPGYCTGNQQWL